ncbi:MAG TPA: hypothetical protein VJ692_03420 [Nitrospiraceae bacterium]|nr:hypothetical protein [Nitrospiraceae bacterium]
MSRHGLQLNEDVPFQRRVWRIQRIGWMAMAGLLLAALSGVFGQGWLSDETAANSSGTLWIDYERFGRWESTLALRVHVGSGASPNGTVRIRLDQDYLSNLQIEGMMPEPDSTETSATAVTYVFRTTDADQQAVITLYTKMKRFGVFTANIQAGGEPPVSFRQIIYP